MDTQAPTITILVRLTSDIIIIASGKSSSCTSRSPGPYPRPSYALVLNYSLDQTPGLTQGVRSRDTNLKAGFTLFLTPHPPQPHPRPLNMIAKILSCITVAYHQSLISRHGPRQLTPDPFLRMRQHQASTGNEDSTLTAHVHSS